MPAFDDDNILTQQEPADLEIYTLKLNGVDRTQPDHPDMPPQCISLVTADLLRLLVMGLVLFWLAIRRSPGTVA